MSAKFFKKDLFVSERKREQAREREHKQEGQRERESPRQILC